MTNPTEKVRIVRCPACGGDSIYSSTNTYRPFCSERCKMVDLGAWLAEERRIPGPAAVTDFPEDSHDDPGGDPREDTQTR